jgi:hypothetical protein
LCVETLQWLQLAAQLHLYETVASLDLSDRENTPWASGFQLSQRITYLRTVEKFLDNSIQLSSDQYEFLSIVDWLDLVSGLTMLGKLALHSTPMPGWDTNELQIPKTFEYFRDRLCALMPRPRDAQDSNEDVFERFRRITAIMKSALKTTPARASPNGSTFELATGSGRTVSLLQDLPPLLFNSNGNGSLDLLPAPWKVNPSLDMSSNEFCWKFLLGTI